MTYLDDFNRAAFERALTRYNREQYDQLDTDAWVALVEGYRAEAQAAEDKLKDFDAHCQCGCE